MTTTETSSQTKTTTTLPTSTFLPDEVRGHPDFDACEESLAKLHVVAVRVESEDDYAAAGRFLTEQLVPVERRYAGMFKAIKAPLNELREAINSAERARLGALREIRKRVDEAMADFRARLRREAEEKRKREEEEEKQRAAQRQAALADEAEAEGDTETAEAVRAQPAEAFAAPVPARRDPVVPRVAGLSPRKIRTAEVRDLGRFLRWIAQDPEARGYLVKPVQAELNKAVAGGLATIPGVVVVETETQAVRPQR